MAVNERKAVAEPYEGTRLRNCDPVNSTMVELGKKGEARGRRKEQSYGARQLLASRAKTHRRGMGDRGRGVGGWGGGEGWRWGKADSTLRSSQAVPHPSTNRVLCHLTSEVERDAVHSTRYGRQRTQRSC